MSPPSESACEPPKLDPRLVERMWARAKPLLPPRPPRPRGGRPRACDRACFEAIVLVHLQKLPWRFVPDGYPSAVTCWRRFRDWEQAGKLDAIWAIVREELAAESAEPGAAVRADSAPEPCDVAAAG